MSMWLRDLIYDMEAVLGSFRRCSLVVIKKAAPEVFYIKRCYYKGDSGIGAFLRVLQNI